MPSHRIKPASAYRNTHKCNAIEIMRTNKRGRKEYVQGNMTATPSLTFILLRSSEYVAN